VVYRRTPANIVKLVAALNPLGPYLRGAPPGLPFVWDQRTLTNGLNCISLEELIRVKRAAGRPKDLEVIAELEKLLELSQK
jgi:hypothetical protein